ncbi:MAG: hypothetical protein Q9175_007303 [Cornicularia normoerica]
MSALPSPPPGLDIHASRQPSLYAATIITWVLSVIALDDWLVVAATILVTIFQCNPVSGFWNRNEPADCANLISHFPATSDYIPENSFGGIIIISIVRLVALVQTDLTSPDLDWNLAFVGVWSATEGNMAIVCACLPSLRPILSLITTGSPNQDHYLKNHSDKRYPSSFFAKKSQKLANCGSKGETTDESDSQRKFIPLSEQSARSEASAAKAEPRPFRPDNSFGGDIEMQGMKGAYKGIHVRNDTSVDYSAKRV